MMRELIETFRKPSAEVLAQRELEEARRQLLAAHSAMEYYQSMVSYHTGRIERLEAQGHSYCTSRRESQQITNSQALQ